MTEMEYQTISTTTMITMESLILWMIHLMITTMMVSTMPKTMTMMAMVLMMK